MNEETIMMAIRIAKALSGDESREPTQHPLIGKNVLVRDHKAGVYCGKLSAMSISEGTAELTGARQVWYWTGAAATPGIAARGVGEDSKIGPAVDVVLFNVVQVMPMNANAWDQIKAYKVWND